MKKNIILMLVVFILLAIPAVIYSQDVNKDSKIIHTDTIITKDLSEAFNNTQNAEEEKRVKLYIAAMREAFNIKNGGNKFIAIKKESLVGLDEKSKEKVLEGFKDLSPNLYWIEDIKNDKSFFILDENGLIASTVNGTFLYINLIDFKKNEAVIEATSWYGNLGAVIPTYKAKFKNNQWELKNIGTGIA